MTSRGGFILWLDLVGHGEVTLDEGSYLRCNEMMDGTYQLNGGGCFGDRVHSFLDFIDHGESDSG